MAVRGQVISIRSVRTPPEEESWSKDCVEWVGGVLWDRYKGGNGAGGDDLHGVPADEPTSSVSTCSPEIIIMKTKNKPPRLGYTRG